MNVYLARVNREFYRKTRQRESFVGSLNCDRLSDANEYSIKNLLSSPQLAINYSFSLFSILMFFSFFYFFLLFCKMDRHTTIIIIWIRLMIYLATKNFLSCNNFFVMWLISEPKIVKLRCLYGDIKINYSDPGDGDTKWDFPLGVFNSTVYILWNRDLI